MRITDYQLINNLNLSRYFKVLSKKTHFLIFLKYQIFQHLPTTKK